MPDLLGPMIRKCWLDWSMDQRQNVWNDLSDDERTQLAQMYPNDTFGHVSEQQVDDPEPLDVGMSADIQQVMDAMCAEPDCEPSPCAKSFVLGQVEAGKIEVRALVTIWAALHTLDYYVARDGVYLALAKLRVDGSVSWDGCEFSIVEVK